VKAAVTCAVIRVSIARHVTTSQRHRTPRRGLCYRCSEDRTRRTAVRARDPSWITRSAEHCSSCGSPAGRRRKGCSGVTTAPSRAAWWPPIGEGYSDHGRRSRRGREEIGHRAPLRADSAGVGTHEQGHRATAADRHREQATQEEGRASRDDILRDVAHQIQVGEYSRSTGVGTGRVGCSGLGRCQVAQNELK